MWSCMCLNKKIKLLTRKNLCTHPFLGHFFQPTSLCLSLCNWFQYCFFWTRLAPADTGESLLLLPWRWPLFLFYLICKSPLQWIQESVVSRLGTLKAIQVLHIHCMHFYLTFHLGFCLKRCWKIEDRQSLWSIQIHQLSEVLMSPCGFFFAVRVEKILPLPVIYEYLP